MTAPDRPKSLALIGFGEVGGAFVSGWGEAAPARITAYDVAVGPEIADRLAEHGVLRRDLDAALAQAEVVFSVVTADQALAAAEAAAPHLAAGALWFDCNSCAPGTKQRAAEVIETAGGRYVDVAIMAPVGSARHRTPLLVSGPHAEGAIAVLESLDMRPGHAGAAVGQASSVKMLRSVMVKGLEALTAECFLAARRAGVEERVIGSLEASNPEMEWRKKGAYNLERMMAHGHRRAAEMREVAATVDELGLGGAMSAAAAQWQDKVADTGVAAGEDEGEGALIARLDALLARL